METSVWSLLHDSVLQTDLFLSCVMIRTEFAGLWLAEVQRCQWRIDFDDGHFGVNETAGLRNFNGRLLFVARENPNLEAAETTKHRGAPR